MKINDPGKLAILLVTLLGAILLRALAAIDPATFAWMVGPVIGYVTGNGVLAARRQPPNPVIAHRDDVDDASDAP